MTPTGGRDEQASMRGRHSWNRALALQVRGWGPRPARATPPSRAADFEITKHENPHRCAGRWPAIAAAAMTPRASPLWRLRAVTTGSVRSRDGGN